MLLNFKRIDDETGEMWIVASEYIYFKAQDNGSYYICMLPSNWFEVSKDDFFRVKDELETWLKTQ